MTEQKPVNLDTNAQLDALLRNAEAQTKSLDEHTKALTDIAKWVRAINTVAQLIGALIILAMIVSACNAFL